MENEDEWEKEIVDYISMYKILWRICKKKIMRSLEKNVVSSIFNDIDDKFHFNRINEKFNKWLNDEFVNIIVPEIVEKLELNSIFKMGFMVKNLIDKFLLYNPPISHLKEIPLEEFYPPIQSFHIHLKKEDKTKENLNKLSSETEGYSFIKLKTPAMYFEQGLIARRIQ
ncbi:hypothetical protein HCB25_02200 [Listeria booriae]|uniref:Uncharacterized protein n=1 Tax=Listeria booriae TaxID=1552123 RepID=A0A842FE12_9LIST|nr:hypothetical protein [Listeria booriae]MBC2242859.1 hypothetical protein [Listeria booriae]